MVISYQELTKRIQNVLFGAINLNLLPNILHRQYDLAFRNKIHISLFIHRNKKKIHCNLFRYSRFILI